VASAPAQPDPVRERLLDAAESLFYARGIQAIGMDDIRASAGLPLKRIYQLYPGKQQLVLAFLRRRDERWRARLSGYVDRVAESTNRVLAVFDWMHEWFREPEFRGCAWINAYGELGATTPEVAELVVEHKLAFRRYLRELLAQDGYPESLTAAIYLLAEGAMVSAGIHASPTPALDARRAAAALLATARS
jgi:AcrR family transcriptional regulator